jgi:hypothetical protein
MMAQGHGSKFIDFGNFTAQRTAGSEEPINSTSYLMKYLATSSGGTEMAAAGSSAAELLYYVQPATGEIFYVRRVNFHYADNGAFTPQQFASGSALTNGIIVDVIDVPSSSQLIDFTDGDPIDHNSQWNSLVGVDVDRLTGGASDDALSMRWTLGKSGGILKLTSDEQLRFRIRDDLSGLSMFTAIAQGRILAAPST